MVILKHATKAKPNKEGIKKNPKKTEQIKFCFHILN